MIEIRKAGQADIEKLADIHFRAYFTRYFDATARDISGRAYGAPLAEEHPRLARGQNRAYFRLYWDKFARKLWDGDAAQNICLAATCGTEILGFVKGSTAPVRADDFPAIDAPLTEKTGELGSIYIDPPHKFSGIGRKLVAAYAACLNGVGYGQMVTSAYHKNDSPRFFAKLGARVAGSCAIPNEYIDYSREGAPLAVENIKGVVMHWGPAAMQTLCGMAAAAPPRAAFVPETKGGHHTYG